MTQPVNPGMFAQTLGQVGAPTPYGQFTGYAPLPGVPNGYEFDLASGGKRKMVGPAAQQLAGNIDAAKAYQPGAGPLAAPVGPGGGPAQAPNPNAFNPLVSTKGGGELGVRAGGDPANPMDYVVRTPGRAATKGGMAARGMTTQGGYNVDEQFLDQMEGSQVRTAAIQEEGIQKGVRAAAERQGFMDAQKAQAEREQAVLAHENAIKQQRIGEYQAKYDKAEQDYTGFHDEKEREAASPKAKMATFIGAISSALGALGAGLARTPNFAAEAVARHNEMQLRREEAELRVRKDNRDTMLGQLQQQMGSLDLAKSAYRAMQAKQSAMGFEMLAQKEQDQQKQQQLLQVSELQNQQYLKWREEYVRGAEGEVTRTFQYVPGQAGSRGGNRAPTLEELKGVQDLRKGEAEIDKTRADAGKEKSGQPLGQPALEAISGAVNTITAADSIQKNLTARGVTNETTIDDPVSGGYDRAREAVSPLYSRANNALRADTTAMAKGLQSAFGKSDRDAEDAEAMATGSASGADRLRASQSAKERAVRVVRDQLANMTPEQQRQRLSTMPEVVRREVLGQK